MKELVMGLSQQAVPLITKGMEMFIESKSIEKRAIISDQRIEKYEQALLKFEEKDDAPGRRKSSDNKLSKHQLSTGILEGEDKIALGNRKWKEYENHVSDLSENASEGEVQIALKEIEVNISESYPCEDCRTNAVVNLVKFPLTHNSVKTKSQAKERLCGFHNVTNKSLDKPITVNCTRIES